jgi:hypothetical protein
VYDTTLEIAEGRGLHASIVNYTDAAFVFRDRLLSTRALFAAKSLETMEARSRDAIRFEEDRAAAGLVLREEEVQFRLFAEKHEASARSAIVATWENVRDGASRRLLQLQRLCQAEEEGRWDIADEQAEVWAAEVGTRETERAVFELNSLAHEAVALAAHEQRARRDLHARLWQAHNDALMSALMTLEAKGRASVVGNGPASKGGARSQSVRVYQSCCAAAGRPTSKAGTAILSGGSLGALLMEHRAGGHPALVASLPVARDEQPSMLDTLVAGSRALVDRGELGAGDVFGTVLPMAQFLVTETLLRIALEEGEMRCRRELRLAHSRAVSLGTLDEMANAHRTGLVWSRSAASYPPRRADPTTSMSPSVQPPAPAYQRAAAAPSPRPRDADEWTTAHAEATGASQQDQQAEAAPPPPPVRAASVHPDIADLFKTGDIDGRGRLTLPSVVAVLRLSQRCSDIRVIAKAYNAVVDRIAASRQLSSREANQLRHHQGVDLDAFADLCDVLPA